MDDLDRRYRQMIGDEASDALLEAGVHLHLLFSHTVNGHIAFGHMGGHEVGQVRTLVAGGHTPEEAARGLAERTPAHFRPECLRSSMWALGEAVELLTEAISGY